MSGHTFGIDSLEEDYDESELGLLSDETLTYNAEISYTPGAHASFYLFGNFADRESLQAARQSGGTLSLDPANTWTAQLDESNQMLGLGFTGQTDNGWSFEIESRYSESDGEADLDTPPGGSPSSAVDFDNYEDIELLTFAARAEYAITECCSIGGVYYYEDYQINSFNLNGLAPYITSALLLAPSFGDYEANIFAVYLSFKQK